MGNQINQSRKNDATFEKQHDENPQPGDLIEFHRNGGVFQHWAVYVGDGLVVHLAAEAPCADPSRIICASTKAVVKKEHLRDVSGSDQWRANNILDNKYKPRPTHDIVNEACAKVGEEWPYNVFSRNCEHFATMLRYGHAESQQVLKGKNGVLVMAVVGLGIPAFCWNSFWVFRKVSDHPWVGAPPAHQMNPAEGVPLLDPRAKIQERPFQYSDGDSDNEPDLDDVV